MSFEITEADFQQGFIIVDTTGMSPTQDENEYNCLSDAATLRLQAHMNTLGFHPVITRDYPQPGWGGPTGGRFQQEGPGDGKVGYLDFTEADGVTIDHENAGGIAVEYLKVGNAVSDYNCVNFWYKGDA
jgi:hypothetical protein